MYANHKYFGRVKDNNQEWKTTVHAGDAQEARLLVARRFQRAKAPFRTIAEILYDVSVRRARESW